MKPGKKTHILVLNQGRRTDERVAIMEFLNEARLTRVPRLLDIGVSYEKVKLIMEDAGHSLSSFRFCEHVDRIFLVKSLMLNGSHALSEIHERGILHLDIHEGNFCVAEPFRCQGSRRSCTDNMERIMRTLKLIDFGSAVFTKRLSWIGQTRGGAWGLMPPEQFAPFRGAEVKLTKDTDLFSLAALALSFLTAQLVFDGTSGVAFIRPIHPFQPSDPSKRNAAAFKNAPARKPCNIYKILSRFRIPDTLCNALVQCLRI